MKKRWVIAPPAPASSGLSLVPPLAQVLWNRGLRDPATTQHFLNPQLRDLRDPFELPDMTVAVERVLTAIERKERIVVYGDYDVDGITSSALLARVLRQAGANVTNFLPVRADEGYGLSADGIARCLREQKPQLLIAVDCGTSSVKEIAELRQHGVDVVVLDHHEPPPELPPCVALVNPKRGKNHTPLASVGVTFKLAHALVKSSPVLRETVDLREHLDLVAMGTVADLVPLTGENRILVKAGLERLPATAKTGLRALMDVADVGDEVSPYHIGFRLGPRLNAAGRLADAMVALELLLTTDETRARELALQLDKQNTERQQIEERIVKDALAKARAHATDRVLVLTDETWHVGVIGIVASRVMQEFYRPTVVIGAERKGSCRSIAGFSIVAALQTCAPLLEKFGGHEMAAGLTVKPGRVEELRQQLNDRAAKLLTEEDLVPRVLIDAVVRLDDLDAEFFEQLEKFEPCGVENPTPCFAVENVRVRGAPRVVGKSHLRFSVTDGDTTVAAIWWGMGDYELPRGAFAVAFIPEIDTFGGSETVQLKVKDVRPAV